MKEIKLNAIIVSTSILFYIIGILSVVIILSLFSIFNLQLETPLSYRFYEKYEAPSDFINEKDIQIYPDKIIIKIQNPSLSRYADTGSMLPILDENTNGIKIIPQNEDEINIGDIITFEKNNVLIIHRVIEKGADESGVYFITKGDNNNITDGKIRFEEIKYKTIVLIY